MTMLWLVYKKIYSLKNVFIIRLSGFPLKSLTIHYNDLSLITSILLPIKLVFIFSYFTISKIFYQQGLEIFFFLIDSNNSKYQQLLIHHIRCAFQFGELLSEVRFLFIYLLSSTYLLVDKLWPLVKLGEKKIAILFID